MIYFFLNQYSSELEKHIHHAVIKIFYRDDQSLLSLYILQSRMRKCAVYLRSNNAESRFLLGSDRKKNYFKSLKLIVRN